VTDPEGVPLPVAGETVAVMVVVEPAAVVAVRLEAARTVLLAVVPTAAFTVRFCAVETLLAKVLSPP
jgi:hypothetical protein